MKDAVVLLACVSLLLCAIALLIACVGMTAEVLRGWRRK